MSEKLLPTNPEAETAILGAILLDNNCYNQAAASVSEEDFSLDSHRCIFRAMTELIERGSRVDFVTLVEHLGPDEIKRCGGVAWVTSLTDGLPRVKNIAQYARIVKEKARSRMLINVCNSAQASAYAGAAPDDVLATLQQNVIDIFHHGRGARTPSLPELARESLEQMHLIRSMKSRSVGLTTGIAQLDEMTTGLRRGEFYVIGARPANGKTALACQAVRANCLAGVKCGLFSVEMTGQQIIQRLAAMETGVDLFDLRDPRNLNASELAAVTDAVAGIAQWPLLVEDSGRITIKEIGALARMFISQCIAYSACGGFSLILERRGSLRTSHIHSPQDSRRSHLLVTGVQGSKENSQDSSTKKDLPFIWNPCPFSRKCLPQLVLMTVSAGLPN